MTHATRRFPHAAVMILFCLSALTADDRNIPVSAKKQTTLGLYVTAEEAFRMWVKDPQETHILDVRTPEEYLFVGHATMAVHIPYMVLNRDWYRFRDRPLMRINPDFVSWVSQRFAKDDLLLVMCRSGGRSAAAVNQLARSGFTRAYSIIDGFEGDFNRDSQSYYQGRRYRNGWKNSGAPWTQRPDADSMAGYQKH